MTKPLPSQRIRSAMVLIGLVGLVALFELVAASPAPAAGGVHFDPESPAGKEYALPLDQARKEATGNESLEGTGQGSEVQSAGESAPLFGEGVSGGGAGTAGPEGESGSPGKGENGQAQGPSPKQAGQAGASGQLPQVGDGGYPALAGFGLVALVVLIGVGLGLAMRGIQRTRPT